MPQRNKSAARKPLSRNPSIRIGVDTGGTFTDCVVLEGGQVKVLKVFSTPVDPSKAIVEGILKIANDEILGSNNRDKIRNGQGREAPSSILEVIHGTTVGTNSLLERRGAHVALVTTAGFEDLLEIGRQARPSLYDLNVHREPPLATRAMRFGVKERIGADGQIVQPISDGEIRRIVSQVKKSGADSIALCFLFAFANPIHERQVAAALESLGLPLSVSSDILPEFREFERLSTVVINAYLAPRMGTYLRNLETRMDAEIRRGHAAQSGVQHHSPIRYAQGRIFVMQSNGGISTAVRAAQQPVRTILSGPAGGVVASAWLAQQIGLKRAISFDMGEPPRTFVCSTARRAQRTRPRWPACPWRFRFWMCIP